jgi:carbamoyl-phosphate synthase large subunit
VFISVRNADKENAIPIARLLSDCGFKLLSSRGTYEALKRAGIKSKRLPKLAEGRPNIIDFMKNGDVQLIINTATRKGPETDEGKIRASAVINRVPIVTTLTGGLAVAKAIAALQTRGWDVKPLQAYFPMQRG